MDGKIGSRPMVIRYSEEEYASYDEGFLQVSGIVTIFSRRSRRKGPGSRSRKVKRESNADAYYI